MTTIFVMIALLVGPYLLALVGGRLGWTMSRARAARVGLAVMFAFTAAGHFTETDAMSRMMPPAIPWRVEIIYLTGVFEFVLAAFVARRATARPAAMVAIAFLAAALPANIYAAIEAVPMGGHAMGPVYLAARVPLQLLIAGWAYWWCVRPAAALTSRREPIGV